MKGRMGFLNGMPSVFLALSKTVVLFCKIYYSAFPPAGHESSNCFMSPPTLILNFSALVPVAV